MGKSQENHKPLRVESLADRLIRYQSVAISMIFHFFILALVGAWIIQEQTTYPTRLTIGGDLMATPASGHDHQLPMQETHSEFQVKINSPVKPPPAPWITPPVIMTTRESDFAVTFASTAGDLQFKNAPETISGNGTGSPLAGTGRGTGSGEGRGSEGNGSKVNFFGIEDKSDRITILVDISGSMITPDKGGMEGFSRVKQELVRLIDGLSPGTSFNVVLFGSQAFRLADESLLPAATENKQLAETWMKNLYDPARPFRLDKIIPEEIMSRIYAPVHAGIPKEGGTRIDVALLAAFELHPDVIFVISDGAPNIEGWTPSTVQNKIEDWKKEYFTLKKHANPRIHVVSYEADGPGNNFMQTLARRNNGKFLRIGGFHAVKTVFVNPPSSSTPPPPPVKQTPPPIQ